MNVRRDRVAEWICKRRSMHRALREFVISLVSPNFRDNHIFEVDFFGMKYVGNTNNYLDYQVLLRGAYEKFMLFFMKDVVTSLGKQETVFLDIGANVGNHSLFMSKYVSEVHAFEPYELARKEIENKVSINGINNIIIHPVGLGNKNEIITFYAPPSSNIGIGFFSKKACEQKDRHPIKLQVVIGDEVISKKNINDVDLIKVDVEGYERHVLEGLNLTMTRDRPVVLFEFLEETKKSIGNIEELTAFFPKNYVFLVFSKRNKKNGRYKLSQFNYEQHIKCNEIIAYPQEKLRLLPKYSVV